MNDAVDIAQKASQWSDRVLFITVIILLGGFILWVIKYFVKQHDTLIEEARQSRITFQNSTESMLKQTTEAVVRNTAALDNNSHVMEGLRPTLDECNTQLRLCRDKRFGSQ